LPPARARRHRKDLRLDRTRRLLEGAFVELLSERTCDSISVQAITARAGVNRATFYLHFQDKSGLFDALMRDMFRQLVDQQLPAGSTLTRSNLRALILATLQAFEEIKRRCNHQHAGVWRPLVPVVIQEELFEQLAGWLEQLPGPSSSDSLATVLSWAVFGAGMDWDSGPESGSAEQMAGQVAQILMDGLATIVPADAAV
jgi:AcrR family transcriptional regulator